MALEMTSVEQQMDTKSSREDSVESDGRYVEDIRFIKFANYLSISLKNADWIIGYH